MSLSGVCMYIEECPTWMNLLFLKACNPSKISVFEMAGCHFYFLTTLFLNPSLAWLKCKIIWSFFSQMCNMLLSQPQRVFDLKTLIIQ